ENWSYSDAARSFRFNKDSISAGEYVILCAMADTGRLTKYGRVIGIASWPALNNNTDHLTLTDDKGRLISEVSYSDTWYQNDQKKLGGWTLEQIDPDAVCTGIRNWQASTHPSGGTPGAINSVYKIAASAEPLKIAKVAMVDSVSLSLHFNRYTDSLTATDQGNYTLNNGLGKPQSVYYSDLFTVILKFSEPLTRGTVYRITVNNLRDCAGSLISTIFNEVTLAVPKKVMQGDILISEILFNPRAEGVDFVEIYNNSSQDLDIHELYIANVPLPDSLGNAKRLSTDSRSIKPGGFLVLTSDPEKVKKEYHTENPDGFLKVSTFPSFNNDKGIVTILRNNELVDQFAYTEKMHMPLIKNSDGISLERSDYKTAANEHGNFRSASASAGFATPGYKNSQYLEELGVKDDFSLASSTFSPDNDGFEDLMQINYLLDKPGFIANITIYNDRGNMVRKLYQNYSLSTSGILNWDGRDEFSELKTAGIYLVYAELFNTDGEVKKFRKTVVLARKFN
ncbi:MAG TPA: lamin tail domain-containing protein, partial [Daejeonella sp.]|nr:lamin tail domain-containing protein [Daejeonella sp.]